MYLAAHISDTKLHMWSTIDGSDLNRSTQLEPYIKVRAQGQCDLVPINNLHIQHGFWNSTDVYDSVRSCHELYFYRQTERDLC